MIYNTTHVISLSDVRLNPPPQRQHNEGVGGCNEGNSNAVIRRLEWTIIKTEFPT